MRDCQSEVSITVSEWQTIISARDANASENHTSPLSLHGWGENTKVSKPTARQIMYHVTALTSKHYVESISDHFLVAEMVVLRHHYSPLRITMGKFREKIKSAMSMLQWLYTVISVREFLGLTLPLVACSAYPLFSLKCSNNSKSLMFWASLSTCWLLICYLCSVCSKHPPERGATTSQVCQCVLKMF